jgi:cytidine deaminase
MDWNVSDGKSESGPLRVSDPKIVSAGADAMWSALSESAWACRERAFILGKTRVGAALLADGEAACVVAGCNVEHKYRCHDVHAEVNAISSMVSSGASRLRAILIAAERERFTPCGACMDWIFQFGGPECLVAFQTAPDGPITIFMAQQLMPFYPR